MKKDAILVAQINALVNREDVDAYAQAGIMAFDMQPMVTLQEKEAFLNEAADNQYILFLEHDIFHECCTVQRTEKGVRLMQAIELRSI